MSAAVQRVIDALETSGCNPRPAGKGYTARCPGHEDKIASLSISEGDDGRALLMCHAGCSFEQVVDSLGLAKAALFDGPLPERPREKRYPILDVDRQLIATHVRRDMSDGKKLIHWERNGKPTLGGLPLTALPLYGCEHLATTPDTESVFVVEGEKAADALRARGFVAVGTVTGAASCPSVASLLVLAGRDVILWPDHDGPGRQHMQKVWSGLLGVARSVRLFGWKKAPEHGDAHDYFAQGGTREELLAELVTAPPAEKPAKEKRAQGTALKLSDVEPADEPVDGQALLEDIRLVFERYVVLPTRASSVIALWVALTYLVDSVDVLPRLLLWSPVWGCGKTRALTVLGALARRALQVAAITESSLFRVIDQASPTLLMDEMDNARIDEKPEVRAILNAGHNRGSAYVVKTDPDSLEPRLYAVFAPIALACIGKMPETVASRAIHVPMRRRTKDEVVARMRESRVHKELLPLRRQLMRWSRDHHEAIERALEDDSCMLGGLGDREAENWSALVAIAHAAGGVWPERVKVAASELSGSVDTQDDSDGIQLLADVKGLFGDKERLTSAELLEKLRGLEERKWGKYLRGDPISARELNQLLRPFEIASRNIRTGVVLPNGKDEVRRGFDVEQFEEAWERYLLPDVPANPHSPRYNATDRMNSGRNPVIASATPEPRSGSDNTVPTNNDAVGSAVATSGGGNGHSSLWNGHAAPGDPPPVHELDADDEDLPMPPADDFDQAIRAMGQVPDGGRP